MCSIETDLPDSLTCFHRPVTPIPLTKQLSSYKSQENIQIQMKFADTEDGRSYKFTELIINELILYAYCITASILGTYCE